ncbi:rhodanese-related sulfurtransferase [Hydrogenophaga palleronii]|uniref:Rhodanese-related sulfurtransferase n=1 Tax=Hydrogenophaga palleronii TaxID=65655 RepID=A0ABU1WTV9_9BURK|nr:rhodanese-like domain-containing protein [Hydrogenophaga palleronii]MDR7152734.1 rhodanese-related sulfurtransferase [Hydrogenophaga palleronii]
MIDVTFSTLRRFVGGLWSSALVAGAVAFCLHVFSLPAWGQALDPSELPNILKELPRAGSMCRRDDGASAGMPAAGGSASDVDPACIRPPGELLSQIGKQDAALIDLRPRAQFDRFRVREAISSSESELVVKPYWKEQQVILMGRGVDDLHLSSVCTRLKKSGYKRVSVLQGGVIGLVREGIKLVGVPVRLDELVQLSAADVWFLTQQPGALVLTDATRSDFLKTMPDAMQLSQVDEQGLKKAMQSRAGTGKSQRVAPAAVVLLVSSSPGEDELNKLLAAASPSPLFVFTGTHTEFGREMARQDAVWKARERGPKKTACLG